MHIAEGLLAPEFVLGYSLAAGIVVAKGVSVYGNRSFAYPPTKQLTGVLTAAVFIISLLPIPVPFTGTDAHPAGTPLVAIFLGPFIPIPMSLVALLMQALLLGHGGLTSLGANTLAMGLGGGTIGYFIWYMARKQGLNLTWSGGLAGFIGDLSIYLVTSAELAWALHGPNPFWHEFGSLLLSFLPIQLPIAVIEGVFTALVIRYIAEHRPDLLPSIGQTNNL